MACIKQIPKSQHIDKADDAWLKAFAWNAGGNLRSSILTGLLSTRSTTFNRFHDFSDGSGGSRARGHVQMLSVYEFGERALANQLTATPTLIGF